ncbi:hypothetical protein AGABI1DRAFT_105474 [Agaricus bisporus var. burnettii JB137-S8]|uniref:PROP1-like PPR domain-containing protein n=1 Tax=Agaricus bisporus var. burnettii (strain JB137-S8 / ATCC MYA-4627 / FGSC 10392) TaxID=597362 RepID=K5W5R1_AGABU|nr:uncharacterized protein AGABI1DRAFT_105474 [Agaricus bisporus var. burnettii JB137-S8]EKM82144.1 hypothetical protein AGABI1DRAFT_105474 [Agaricus bisporus var. burnettii JB137-S8]
MAPILDVNERSITTYEPAELNPSPHLNKFTTNHSHTLEHLSVWAYIALAFVILALTVVMLSHVVRIDQTETIGARKRRKGWLPLEGEFSSAESQRKLLDISRYSSSSSHAAHSTFGSVDDKRPLSVRQIDESNIGWSSLSASHCLRTTGAVMLPKVATHLFHTTSRVAAQAVHRNVLQQTGHSTGSNLGTWNGPSSSNWGGQGTGTGNSKHNTGSSRYYSFSTAGRAVSQANAVSANVDGSFASDENDEPTSRRVVVISSSSQSKRARIRSSSATLTNAESLGVLKALQLRRRSRFLHTSIEAVALSQPALIQSSPSRPRRNSTSSSDGLDRPSSPVRTFTTATAVAPEAQDKEQLLRPRRNSTSSIDDRDKSAFDSFQSVLDEELSIQSGNSASSIDDHELNDVSSIETKPTTPSGSPKAPLSNSPPSRSSASTYPFEYLIEARLSSDPHRVAEAVARFRSTAQSPQTVDFNNALDAMYATRRSEPLHAILDVYQDMISRSIQPDERTFSILIQSAVDRDHELGHGIRGMTQLMHRQGITGGGIDNRVHMGLQYKLESYSSEYRENFATVLSLYYAARVNSFFFSPELYLELIRTTSRHSNIELAEEIFQLAQKRCGHLQPYCYRYMIQGYGRAGDAVAAERVFEQYNVAAREGRLSVDDHTLGYQRSHILVWNAMIESYFLCGLPDKAVGILDKMMNSPADLGFGIEDVPYPASSTYTEILKGFVEAGDITTAWRWYERLSEQGVKTENHFWPATQPIKPDGRADILMIAALAERGYVSELNKIFSSIDYTYKDSQTAPLLTYKANMAALKNIESEVHAKRILNFLTMEVFPRTLKLVVRKVMIIRIVMEYVDRNMFEDALASYKHFHELMLQDIKVNEESQYSPLSLTMTLQEAFSRIQGPMWKLLVERKRLNWDFAMQLMACGRDLGIEVPTAMQKHVLHVYALARANNELPVEMMTTKVWEQLLMIAVDVESASFASPTLSAREYKDVLGYAFEGVQSLVEDMAKLQVHIEELPSSLMNKTIRHLISVYGGDNVVRTLQKLGPAFERALEDSEEIRTLVVEQKLENIPENVINNEFTQRLLQSYGNLVVDPAQCKALDDLLRQNNIRSNVLAAYNMLKNGFDNRHVPSPKVIGKLIQGLGRQGEVEMLNEVYAIAQTILDGLMLDAEESRRGQYFIEDNMVIALAHLGDMDSAHNFRLRILEKGYAPSADAYGALILHLKDTTDDASNALGLYFEAQQHKVKMNIYFYNNIISKLAKARKADHALELFQRMKAERILPSSITYGALIGACARVGDVQSAETLFEEMESRRNFRPRVPPYNTMMQLYTMTKPNRERVLHYFDKMYQAGVNPTAHTYKLLLDAYGSIEPVDIPSMEAIFEQLQGDRDVDVQGTHYASLINAYGCIQRDLEKALSIFNSVPSSSTPNQHSVLDAVVFESLVNVFVSHRRTDLIPEYINKMIGLGIHMTAYIANFLIKGYAITGELEKAREIFESMVDPPMGVAAPNNHAPHTPNAGNAIGSMEPVYREPSTWEAMVRAELGAGHRDLALDLLERLKSRQYPEAVYNRISGVLVDHSTLPA